jgi:hypothetical protein
MIWFTCKQCGKTHGREEDHAGTLVFCECGSGNRVPWTSTAAAPAAPPEVPSDPVPAPRRAYESPAVPRAERQPSRQPNPDRCLNHEDRRRSATCDACHEAFCSACVVALESRTLCGPCKDFRARAARRPPVFSALALISCVLALLPGAPVSCCLPMGATAAQADGMLSAWTVVAGVLAFALPLTALILGLFALRNIERKPNVGGRSLALTGTITASLGVLWCLVVYGAVLFKHLGG